MSAAPLVTETVPLVAIKPPATEAPPDKSPEEGLSSDIPPARGDIEPEIRPENTDLDLVSIPDINAYQHKKTLAKGMMDLALFSANANQLRYVLESFGRHPFYYPSLILILFSIICQVAVGIGLVWNAKYDVKDEKQICIANRINNLTIIGIFLITVLNVFISAFGVATGTPAASP